MLTAKPQASGRWAVGAAATSGSVSPGIGYYHSKFELGIDRAHYVYAAEDNLTILALWGGLGRSLSERLNLVYGVSVVNLFQGPKSDFKFSPYIGLDVTNLGSLPILIGAWINPVTIEMFDSQRPNWVIGFGSIKLAYLF